MQYGAGVSTPPLSPSQAPSLSASASRFWAPTLFAGLVDDAAMFPPGNASAVDAIAAHLRYRSDWLTTFVGPLLVHADRWAEFVAAHDAAGRPALDVVVLGTAAPPAPVGESLRIVGYELPLTAPPLPELPAGASLAVEISADDNGFALLTEIAQRAEGDVLGKFRTGGTTAAAFPDEATLARVILAAVEAGAAMKFTAGLHHAIRFTDPETGFEHHGFLNLMTAIETAQHGSGLREVVAALADRDATTVSQSVAAWTPAQVDAVRRTFISFGCCGVEDPIGDLVALGLVTRPEDTR